MKWWIFYSGVEMVVSKVSVSEAGRVPGLIDHRTAQLLLVDLQERLMPAMSGGDAALKACRMLVETASVMRLPIVVSEQYPQGLGKTVPEIADSVPPGSVAEKTEFSVLRNAGLCSALLAAERPQLIVAGVEAHVCVLQSVLDALEKGWQTFVVVDGVASRKDESKATALSRMERAGAVLVTAEMVVFECLENSTSEHFKQLSRLVR